tara:strand:+ start:840 stop:1118 length:279 start_codon:yes stop_codon:yes gene_type:complete
MIEVIQEYRVIVVIGGLIALVAVNWNLISPLVGGWTNRVQATTPGDRANLYDSLIETQNLLAKCGVERDKLDEMTLSEVGRVATTGNYEKTT